MVEALHTHDAPTGASAFANRNLLTKMRMVDGETLDDYIQRWEMVWERIYPDDREETEETLEEKINYFIAGVYPSIRSHYTIGRISYRVDSWERFKDAIRVIATELGEMARLAAKEARRALLKGGKSRATSIVPVGGPLPKVSATDDALVRPNKKRAREDDLFFLASRPTANLNLGPTRYGAGPGTQAMLGNPLQPYITPSDLEADSDDSMEDAEDEDEQNEAETANHRRRRARAGQGERRETGRPVPLRDPHTGRFRSTRAQGSAEDRGGAASQTTATSTSNAVSIHDPIPDSRFAPGQPAYRWEATPTGGMRRIYGPCHYCKADGHDWAYCSYNPKRLWSRAQLDRQRAEEEAGACPPPTAPPPMVGPQTSHPPVQFGSLPSSHTATMQLYAPPVPAHPGAPPTGGCPSAARRPRTAALAHRRRAIRFLHHAKFGRGRIAGRRNANRSPALAPAPARAKPAIRPPFPRARIGAHFQLSRGGWNRCADRRGGSSGVDFLPLCAGAQSLLFRVEIARRPRRRRHSARHQDPSRPLPVSLYGGARDGRDARATALQSLRPQPIAAQTGAGRLAALRPPAVSPCPNRGDRRPCAPPLSVLFQGTSCPPAVRADPFGSQTAARRDPSPPPPFRLSGGPPSAKAPGDCSSSPAVHAVFYQAPTACS